MVLETVASERVVPLVDEIPQRIHEGIGIKP